MWILNWIRRLRKLAPKVMQAESFTEFFSRLVTVNIEAQQQERNTVKSFFTVDPTSSMCTLSPFGADVVSPYVNQEFVLNAKAHYYAGYSGNRMPKVLFNTHKAELELSFSDSIPSIPEYTGPYDKDYTMLVDLLEGIKPLLPLMYYKSRDIEVTFTQLVYSVYRLLYDIRMHEIKDRDDVNERIQDIYLKATDLMYPLSVKGYTILLASLPPYLRVRMVSVKVKSRLTVQHRYAAPPKRT